METLIINFKKKKDLKLVKEMVSHLDAEILSAKQEANQKKLPKSKFKTEEEFRALGGILKGQLISKEHLRSLAWKKRG
jgi:hypothetical protein